MKKSTLKEIKTALNELDDAIAAQNRVASQRVGVISGGPDITFENERCDECYANVIGLLKKAGPRTLKTAAEYNDNRVVADAIVEIYYERGIY